MGVRKLKPDVEYEIEIERVKVWSTKVKVTAKNQDDAEELALERVEGCPEGHLWKPVEEKAGETSEFEVVAVNGEPVDDDEDEDEED